MFRALHRDLHHERPSKKKGYFSSKRGAVPKERKKGRGYRSERERRKKKGGFPSRKPEEEEEDERESRKTEGRLISEKKTF